MIKHIFCISLVSLLSLPVYAGNEFWQWQEDHAEKTQNSVVSISQNDQNYLDEMDVSWVEVESNINEFKSISFVQTPPEKKSVEIKTKHSSMAPVIEQVDVEFLDTKHLLNNRIELRFYQHDLILKDSANWNIDQEINDAASLKKTWQFLATAPTEKLIEQFKIYKEALHLNDWDYAYLIFEYSKLFNKTSNQQKLMTHYLMVQSGYKVQLAFDQNKLILLMNTQSELLDSIYVIDKLRKKWFELNLSDEPTDLGKLTWLNLNHKNSREIMNLRLNPDINLGGKWQNKRFEYQIDTDLFELYLPFQANIVLHSNKYAIVSVSDYINNDVHQQIIDSIALQIEDKIKGLNEIDKINFLLNLTQTLSFDSLADTQYLPKSIQQSVFSGIGSSYERVLLFKALVDRFSGNYMMVVEYDKHLSVGVELENKGKLKFFHVNLNDYVFADPSYKHAKLGDKMPLENNPFYKWHPIY